MGAYAVFPQVYALPGAEHQLAISDRDGEFTAGQDRANVGRHVIRAFHGVEVDRVAVRRQPAHEVFQIPAHVGVGILGNQQGSAGMAQE